VTTKRIDVSDLPRGIRLAYGFMCWRVEANKKRAAVRFTALKKWAVAKADAERKIEAYRRQKAAKEANGTESSSRPTEHAH
jgi:hypothetical protein